MGEAIDTLFQLPALRQITLPPVADVTALDTFCPGLSVVVQVTAGPGAPTWLAGAPVPPAPDPDPVEPEPVEPEPDPVEPEPVEPEPDPVEPEPVEPEPDPVEPEPVEPEPDPVEPEPVEPEPDPVEPEPDEPDPEPGLVPPVVDVGEVELPVTYAETGQVFHVEPLVQPEGSEVRLA